MLEKQAEQQEIKDIIASREDGFGHLLKIARVEKNLSIADISRELRLDQKIILALESEDHTQLPVPAFVCGYIRNYAKFLNIQPEPLVEYYKKEHIVDDLEPGLRVSKEKNSRKASNASQTVIPLLIIVLTMAALGAGGWIVWQYLSNNNIDVGDLFLSTDMKRSEVEKGTDGANGQSDDNPDSLSLPALNESYELQPVEDVLEQDSDSLKDLSDDEASLSSGALPVDNTELVDDSLAAAEGSLSTDSSTPANDTEPLADSSAVTENTMNVVVTAVESELLSSQEAVGETSVMVADNKLILEFSGNSWVSIKDANNKMLSTGLKRAGKILQLEGKKPYKIFLGDARMVTVRINGKIFDHAEYINEKNIARFNVK